MKDDLHTIERLEKSISRMRWVTTFSLLGTLVALFGVRIASPAIAQPAAQPTIIDKIVTHQLVVVNGQGQPVMSLSTNGSGPLIAMGRQNQNVVITPWSIKQTAPNGSTLDIGYALNPQSPSIYLGLPSLNLTFGFSNNRPGMWMTSGANGEHVIMASNGLRFSDNQNSFAGLTASGFQADNAAGANSVMSFSGLQVTSSDGTSSVSSSTGFQTASSVGTSSLSASKALELNLVTADGQQGVRLSVDTNGLTSKSKSKGKEDDWPSKGKAVQGNASQ